MNKLQAFYKSRDWENFVKRLRMERTTPDGLVICEYCGKPIVKAYDCIGHHKEELTPENVDDVTISLNPENIMLVHFRCHNEIHKRFGFAGRLVQNVFVVYGSPFAGKRQWVDSVAESGDIIVDINRLWNAVRSSGCGAYEKPQELRANVFGLRDSLIDMVRVRRGKWHNAYIIGGYALQGERERLAEMVGANKIIFIDTEKEICLERAKMVDENLTQFVVDWFNQYTPTIE